MKREGKKLTVPYYAQEKSYSCGPASLRMIFGYYDLQIDEQEIRGFAGTDRNGTTRKELVQVAKEYYFRVKTRSHGTLEDIIDILDKEIPVLVDWHIGEGHFSVLYGYEQYGDKQGLLYIHDPANSHRHILSQKSFLGVWSYDKPPNWYMICIPK